MACSKPTKDARTKTIDGISVAMIERAPKGGAAPATADVVLFLHGAAYDSTVWDRTGAIDAVVATGRRAVAGDLPGHGATSGSVEDSDKGEFLAALIESIRNGAETVTVVSPSMSGTYTLGLLAETGHSHDQLPQRVVFVAPVGGATFASNEDSRQIPVLAVVGAEDAKFSGAPNDHLAAEFATSQTLTIPDAGHAAYEDQPKAFNKALVEFLG